MTNHQNRSNMKRCWGTNWLSFFIWFALENRPHGWPTCFNSAVLHLRNLFTGRFTFHSMLLGNDWRKNYCQNHFILAEITSFLRFLSVDWSVVLLNPLNQQHFEVVPTKVFVRQIIHRCSIQFACEFKQSCIKIVCAIA